MQTSFEIRFVWRPFVVSHRNYLDDTVEDHSREIPFADLLKRSMRKLQRFVTGATERYRELRILSEYTELKNLELIWFSNVRAIETLHRSEILKPLPFESFVVMPYEIFYKTGETSRWLLVSGSKPKLAAAAFKIDLKAERREFLRAIFVDTWYFFPCAVKGSKLEKSIDFGNV